jgi:glycine cleavage system H lipoate-binding protein
MVIAVGVLIVGLVVRFALLLLLLTVLALPVWAIAMGEQKLHALLERFGAVVSVGGLPWKAGLYYAPGHTWVKRTFGAARVGLDGVAQRLISGARAVELPLPGMKVLAGETVSRVTCGDKCAAIVSPVDGVVTAANEALSRNPSALHRDPYREGWLFEVTPAKFDYTRLRRGRSAQGWFGAEAARLRQFLERDLGLAAADGGELIVETPALLNDKQWTALTESFLNPKALASAGGANAAGSGVPSRTVALLLAVGSAAAGGLYVIFFPIIGLAALIGLCSMRLWQLLRSVAARVAARFPRRARL